MIAIEPSAPGEKSLSERVVALLRELASELHPEHPGIDALDANASIERDFGLDSLARGELAQRLEKELGIALPEAAVAEAETALDLVRALLQAGRAAPRAPRVSQVVQLTGGAAAPEFTTLLEALEWHAAREPQRAYVLFEDREDDPEPLTYGELQREAAAVAAGLLQRGTRPGEAVALMLPTGREFFAAFFGALLAKAVPVPLYPPARFSQMESHLRRVAGILANCEARILVTFDRARPFGRLLRSLQTRLSEVLTVNEISVRDAAFDPVALQPSDTAFLQYTSGSTGNPKGVVLTHRNLLANLYAMRDVARATADDCFVSWLPLYHDMGLIGACLGALVVGYPLVLMSPLTFLQRPVRWLRCVSRHRATMTAGPNFAWELCLNKIADDELKGVDLSSIRLAFNGAESVSARTLEGFAARFAPFGFRRSALMPVYGLAECALGLTFPPPGRGPLVDHIDREKFMRTGRAVPTDDEARALSVVSCGRPLPGHAVRIVNRGGEPVPERTQGRIQFTGPSATSGYYRNPQATEALFDGEWLESGDLGYLADGELYVTGRSRDMIVRGGHNIHPQELEEAIGRVPGVRKGGVAVFAATDRHRSTERVIALVETREERPDRRAEIVSRVNALAVELLGLPVDEVVLAPPRTVLKTSSGKIRRAACREAFERGQLIRRRPQWMRLLGLTAGAAASRWSDRLKSIPRVLWGIWAALVAALLAPPMWIAVMLAPDLAKRRRLTSAFVRLAFAMAGVRIHIDRHESPGPTPCVFVSNHASYLDVVVLIAALPANITFIAKRELADSSVLGPLLRRLDCVFVERHDVHEAAAAARALQKRLERGESLVVFPEGTFRREPGLLPFHMGAFAAAVATGTAVVPVALCGTRQMLPDGRLLPRPRPLTVAIGRTLVPADRGWRSAVQLRREARAHILAHVCEPDLERTGTRAS